MAKIEVHTLSDNSDQKLYQKIAELHRVQLKAGILAELSINALSRFYRFVATNEPHSVLIIATRDNDVCGFICGTLDLQRLYIQFIKRHPITAISNVLFLATKPALYKRIGSLIQYIGKPAQYTTQTKAELLSMAVSPSNMRSGTGRCLLEALANYFKRHEVLSFKVISSHTQQEAHRFYRAMGGEPVGTLEIGLLESVQYHFDLQNKT